MIESLLALAALGLVFGVVLGVANKKLHVETDPRVDRILEALPGSNCGACGYPGCAGCAEAISRGDAPVSACIPGGSDVADCIGDIMGVDAGNVEAMIARIVCQGTTKTARGLYNYEGISSCVAVAGNFGGPKECRYGCFGLGTCAHVCPFDAITMTEDGYPDVSLEKCTGCGICVINCPQSIIRLSKAYQRVFVSCSNPDKPKDAKAVCDVACIKCKRCEKACPFDAIKVIPVGTGTLAQINDDLCTNCGCCAEVCPTNCIQIIEPLPSSFEPPKVVVQEPEPASGCGGCAGCNACG